jgi:fructuronate reductase
MGKLSRLLRALAETLGYLEGLPMAAGPRIIQPAAFLREVLEVRFPNPYLRDTPYRINVDISQTRAPRFGNTIQAYRAKAPEKLSELRVIPLVFAGWARYLTGLDDAGAPMPVSPDPLLPEVMPCAAGFRLGGSHTPDEIHNALQPIYSRTDVFGLNLYDTPLGARAEEYFAKLIQGKNAVRRVVASIKQNGPADDVVNLAVDVVHRAQRAVRRRTDPRPAHPGRDVPGAGVGGVQMGRVPLVDIRDRGRAGPGTPVL